MRKVRPLYFLKLLKFQKIKYLYFFHFWPPGRDIDILCFFVMTRSLRVASLPLVSNWTTDETQTTYTNIPLNFVNSNFANSADLQVYKHRIVC